MFQNEDLYVDIYGRMILIFISLLWWILILDFMVQKNIYNFYFYIHCFFGFIILYYTIQKEFYLPFLNKTIFPCSLLQEKIPENATRTIHLDNLPPNVNIVYWAADSSTKDIETNPWMAYNKFLNSGITHSDSNGNADLEIREPVKYNVGKINQKTLPKHVHYRYCQGDGFLSKVHTAMFE